MSDSFLSKHKLDLLSILTILLVLLLFFIPLLLNFTTLTFGNDLGLNWNAEYHVKRTLNSFGQFPLWQTFIMSGYPLDSSNLAAIFYPPHLLFLVLPLKIAFNSLTLFHFFLLGLNSYLLSRFGFGLNKSTSLFVALGIMLSPKLFNHIYLGHFNPIESISWMPLSLLLFIKSVEKRNIYLALLCGLTLALSILSHSVFYIYSVFAIGIFSLVDVIKRVASKDLRSCAKTILVFVVSLASSLLYSSVFLLPFLNFTLSSSRTKLGFWDGAFPSIYKDTLLQLFYPLPHRFHDSETLIYVGLPVIILCLIGLVVYFGKKYYWFLIAVLLFALTVSFGANEIFYKIYYLVLPIFKILRAPMRIWILFIFASVILAGFAWEKISSRFDRRVYKTFFASLILVTLASLWVYDRDYFVFEDYEKTKKLTFLKTGDEMYRIYCLDNCLNGPEGIEQNISLSSGNEAVVIEDYKNFMRLAGGYEYSGQAISVPPSYIFNPESVFYENQKPDPKLLGLTSTKYLLSRDKLDDPKLDLIGEFQGRLVYENRLAMPRAYTVSGLIHYKEMKDLKEINFDKNVAFLGNGKDTLSDQLFQEVAIGYYSPNLIKMNFSTNSKKYLVLNDIYYPGWEAFDKGKKLDIKKANGVFRSVELESGDHEISFVYFPVHLKIGMLISVFSIGGLAILLYWKLLRPYRRQPSF